MKEELKGNPPRKYTICRFGKSIDKLQKINSLKYIIKKKEIPKDF